VIHGTNKLWTSVPTPATALATTTLPPGTAHSLLATARLIVLPFAATMAASSPVAGVLRLVRSFIHRCPVNACFDKLKAVSPGGLAPML